MKVVWELGEGGVKDIQNRLLGARHYNSVLTIIRVLEQKGHLTHREKGRNHIYRPTENQKTSRGRILNHLVNQVFGGSASSMVINLVETGDLSRRDLDEIRRRVSSSEKDREKE